MSDITTFQSQTRSRSTCDPWQNRQPGLFHVVSISDEKPLHMRLGTRLLTPIKMEGFNLRREAAPHATPYVYLDAIAQQRFQSQTRSRSTCDKITIAELEARTKVSISDEKPLHMRQFISILSPVCLLMFQSQTRSRSTCDFPPISAERRRLTV